jgi:antitoxin FitA
MASLTIRKLDDTLKRKLRLQAAKNGRSMEEEARRILAEGLQGKAESGQGVASAIAAIVDPIGGFDIEIPERTGEYEPPRFDDWPEDP